MKVKELISLLREMPQNLEVGVSAHDNAEWEVGGWPCAVILLKKSDWAHIKNEPMLDDIPYEQIVNIHC